MPTAPIFARHGDNILTDAVITSTVAPSSTYALTTLATMDAAQRVRWGVKTVTITFTLGGSARGDVLCIPMHNLEVAGSPLVLRLTNAAGFSEPIDIPALRADGFPPTLCVDLTALDTAFNRTSAVWNLVIESNAENLVLGGAVAIYQSRSFLDLTVNDAFTGEFSETESQRNIKTPNEYGTLYVQEYGTASRSVDFSIVADLTGTTAIRDWFRSNRGSARPSLLWPYPDEPDHFEPYFGLWQDELRIEVVNVTYRRISMTFTEWPKGQVIA